MEAFWTRKSGFEWKKCFHSLETNCPVKSLKKMNEHRVKLWWQGTIVRLVVRQKTFGNTARISLIPLRYSCFGLDIQHHLRRKNKLLGIFLSYLQTTVFSSGLAGAIIKRTFKLKKGSKMYLDRFQNVHYVGRDTLCAMTEHVADNQMKS